jgi:predicted CopG family antitoxin
MKKKERKEPYRVRGIRIDDEVWQAFESLKPRDKSWNLFILELLERIRYFKNL